jgi:hypothetical protein
VPVPIINVGGDYQNVTHISHLIPLPTKTAYGNLGLKWQKIVSRLIRINRLISDSYQLHSEALTLHAPVIPSPIEELSFVLEEIAYWLRRTADEIIGLSFLCEISLRGSPLPNKLEIDCIGRLVNGAHPELRRLLAAHLPHLQILNNISNAYKHSFINSNLNLIGRDEPVLYALNLPFNDLNKGDAFLAVCLGKIIGDFDSFFQTTKVYLRTWPMND